MRNDILNRFLPFVSKPGKYLGNEINSIHKNAENLFLGTLLSPNIYEKTMGVDSFRRLYILLNKSLNAYWQRAFLPDLDDAAEVLRQNDIPLFTLEENIPVREAHTIIVYIEDSIDYLFVGKLFSLCRIPAYSKERAADDPLLIAMGPGILNPEPVSSFFDGFAIGEFEAFLPVFESAFKLPYDKNNIMEILEKKPGFYFPGRLQDSASHGKIQRQFIKDLSSRFYPSKLPIPHIDIKKKHNCVEMMRGTVEGNRAFADQYINRPVRKRRAEDIALEIKNAIRFEGEKVFEISAINPEENPDILKVIKKIKMLSNDYDIRYFFEGFNFDVNSATENLFKSLVKNRYRFRPITIDQKLRERLNLASPVNDIKKMLSKLIALGWEHFNFEFLLGIPGETEKSLLDNVSWLNSLAELAMEKPQITFQVEIGCFIPEPFTPLQWENAIDKTTFMNRVCFLKEQTHIKNVSYIVAEPNSISLKTLLFRSGNSLAEDLLDNDYTLEEWYSHFFEQSDGKSKLEALSLYDKLPWDFIDMGVSSQFLQNERMNAIDHKYTFTCQFFKCYSCGLQRSPFNEFSRCFVDSEGYPQPGKFEHVMRSFDVPSDKLISYGRRIKKSDSPGQQLVKKMRVKYIKKGVGSYLNHQDVGRLFDRASRISGIPIAYTQGKIPKPKLSFGMPLTLGYESDGEFIDIELLVLKETEMLEKVNKFMPTGIVITEAKSIFKKVPSLINSVSLLDYKLLHTGENNSSAAFFSELENLWQREEILLQKEYEDGDKIDIKAYWHEYIVDKEQCGITLKVIEGKTIRLNEILELCSLWKDQQEQLSICRTGQYYLDSTNKKMTMMDLL